jgi:hypothetical protein
MFPHVTEGVLLLRRVLLSSRVGRVFVAAYLLAIHGFMFALIYYAAWTSQPVLSAAAPSSGAAPADVPP